MGEQIGIPIQPAAPSFAPQETVQPPNLEYGNTYRASPGAHPNAYFPHWGKTPQSELGRAPVFVAPQPDWEGVGRASLSAARQKWMR